MKLNKYLLILLIIILLNPFSLFALEIKKIDGFVYDKNILINIYYKDFPFQELVLALKAQKRPILLEYKFEVYKKRFLLRDILLHREKYHQKLVYNPEENLYYLEDKFGLKKFEKAEDAILSIVNVESYPLKFTLPQRKNKLALKVKVKIEYSTHLSDDLRYTKKIHNKKIEVEKSANFDEIFAKY
ncbi:MAG: hypothetical protein MW689_000509 [Thermodesulfobacteria bacterium]|nr:hypothetical protein [Thermodesulfobacteriota bacterium]MCU4138720.1 hypothetical protein [Thermodesulfobacteriota bacterium]